MQQQAGRATRGPRESGFTFIEVLVVMGIIAVLAGMTFVGISLMSKKRPEFLTKTTMQKLSIAAGSWQRRFERLPPSDARKIQKVAGGSRSVKSIPNTTNEGIESLFQALYWDTAGVNPQIGEEGELGNTDEDELGEAVTSQGPKLFEVLDGWGNPLIYFVSTDYAKAADSPPAYVRGDGEEVYPRPWRYGAEGRTGFAQPDSFQIFSMGPDGEPNTEDDVKSWDM